MLLQVFMWTMEDLAEYPRRLLRESIGAMERLPELPVGSLEIVKASPQIRHVEQSFLEAAPTPTPPP